MKKLLSVLVAVMMLFAFTSVAFAAVTDIAGHWAAADIQALIDKGIVSGDDMGKFNPEGKVTREQYAKMVVLAKGLAVENPATATFSDVPKTAWSFGYVEAAAKAGLIKGFDGKYNPAANITRQDVAVVVARALNLDTTGTPDFTDAASIASYAKGSVAAAAKAGIVKGADGKFNPTANATRAEASVMTLRQTKYVAPVVTNKLTKIYKDGSSNVTHVTIDGKKYQVSSDIQYFAGSQKVSQEVLRENTVVAYEKLTSDKIYKITVAAPDYAAVSGKITSIGKDSTDKFVMINGTKVYYDNTDSEYASFKVDDDDIVAVKDGSDYVEPGFERTYLVVKNAKGEGYYFLDLAAKDQEGKVTAAGKDSTGRYVIIAGKTYYLHKDIVVGDITGAGITSLDNLSGLVDKLATLTLDQDNKVTKIACFTADIKGIVTEKPIYVKVGTAYSVYLKVNIIDDKTYTNTVKYLRSEEAIDEDDVDLEEVFHPTAAYVADYVLDGATITVNGASKNLEDIAKGTYVEVDLETDGDVVAINGNAKSVTGLVETLTEDSDDKLTKIKIGTEYSYVGKGVANTSNSASSVIVKGNTTTIKTDYVVTARLNAANEIVAFDKVVVPEIEDGIVVALSGQKSNATNTNDSAYGGDVFVPDNTVEVKYWNGGNWNYVWVKLGFTDYDVVTDTQKGTVTTNTGRIGDGDGKADAYEITTTIAKAGVKQGWIDLAVNDKVVVYTGADLNAFNGGSAPLNNALFTNAGVVADIAVEK